MKGSFVILLSFFAYVSGFTFKIKPTFRTNLLMSDQNEEISKDTFKLVGNTPPLGFFDPIGFVSRADETTVKRFREAEIQHGRIAMVASLFLPFLDISTNQPAINALRLSDTNTQLFALWLFAMYEGNRILSIYDSPFNEETQFKLKPDAVPGQYFTTKEYPEEKQNKELNNGRLAMIGVAGFIAQELVTGQPIF